MEEHGVLCYFLPALICLLLLSQPRIGVVGDCSPVEDCHQTHNGSTLRFIDPNPQLEISVERGKYLIPSMSCQAEGFNHIEWLKDDSIGFPFNFTYDSSRCHLSLQDCNQTVVITDTQKEVVGNYTCLVSNDEHTIQRTFTVCVQDEKFIGDPYSINHANCSNNAVRPGEDIYLFCEFCAGDKAQVTEVRWHKLDEDGNLVPISQLSGGEDKDESRYLESDNIYTRDCLESYNLPAAVGRRLIIRDVTPDLFGSYVLTANYTLNGVDKADSEKVTVSRAPDMIIEITVGVVISVAVIFVFVTTVTMICYNHHLTLQLYWKNRFGKIEEHDGMNYDAFISFSDSSDDGRFAIAIAEVLLRQDYNVWMRDMHAIPGEALIAEEIVSMKRSRRCILVISPEYPTSSHSQVLTDLAAEQTLRKKSRIIPILYRDVSREHLKQHQRLAEIVRVCPCITWKEMEDTSSSEVPDNHISGWGSSEVPRSGSGAEEMPSNSNQPLSEDGRGFESAVCDQSQQSANCGSNQVTGANVDEVTLVGHNHDDMRMAPRDGDRHQLIEDEEEQEKKRKLKLKKQWEKNEKRLLLKMPPKRVIAHPAGNSASSVV